MKFALSIVCLIMVPLISGCGGCGSTAAKIKAKGKEIEKMTAEKTANSFLTAVADLNLKTLWAHLPDSWQSDINSVAHAFAENMDAEVWNQAVVIVKKFNQLLKTKQQFCLAYMKDTPYGRKMGEKLNGDKIDSLSKTLDLLLASDLASLDKMKNMDVGVFLVETFPDAKEKLKMAIELLPVQDAEFLTVLEKMKEVKVEKVEEQNDNATVTITGAPISEVKVKRVDKKFVPVEMANSWTKAIENAKNELQSDAKRMTKRKEKALPNLKIFESALDKLLLADSQEKFNRIIEDTEKILNQKTMEALEDSRIIVHPPIKKPSIVEEDLKLKELQRKAQEELRKQDSLPLPPEQNPSLRDFNDALKEIQEKYRNDREIKPKPKKKKEADKKPAAK